MGNNYLTAQEYKRRQVLLDTFDQRGKKGFTLEEAKELVDLVQRDAYIDQLIGLYQQNPQQLSKGQQNYLSSVLYQIGEGNPDKIKQILSVPVTQRMDDARVSLAYAKAKQQVGVDNSMHMQLAKAAKPAVAVLGGHTVSLGAKSPIILNTAKKYGVLASESMAFSVGISYILERDYTISNLISDLTLGVLVGKKVQVLSDALSKKPLQQSVVWALGQAEGYYAGNIFSKEISNILKQQDKGIFNFAIPERQPERGK